MKTLALALIVVLAAGAAAEEPHAIKVKEVGKGDVRRNDVRQNTQTVSKIVGTNGAVIYDKTAAVVQQAVYRETMLERESGKPPSKLKREYEKAVASNDGKAEALPYEGKTVLIERGPDGYRFQIEGGAGLTNARLLEREFQKDEQADLQKLVLPPAPVALNGEWKIDMEAVGRLWERGTAMRVEATKATGTGRLTKVYKKDGRTFGVMSLKLEMPIVAMGTERQKVKLDAGAKVVMDVTLDACIDGTAATGLLKASFVLEATATVPAPDGNPARMSILSRGAIHEERVEQAPKP